MHWPLRYAPVPQPSHTQSRSVSKNFSSSPRSSDRTSPRARVPRRRGDVAAAWHIVRLRKGRHELALVVRDHRGHKHHIVPPPRRLNVDARCGYIRRLPPSPTFCARRAATCPLPTAVVGRRTRPRWRLQHRSPRGIKCRSTSDCLSIACCSIVTIDRYEHHISNGPTLE